MKSQAQIRGSKIEAHLLRDIRSSTWHTSSLCLCPTQQSVLSYWEECGQCNRAEGTTLSNEPCFLFRTPALSYAIPICLCVSLYPLGTRWQVEPFLSALSISPKCPSDCPSFISGVIKYPDIKHLHGCKVCLTCNSKLQWSLRGSQGMNLSITPTARSRNRINAWILSFCILHRIVSDQEIHSSAKITQQEP